MSGRICADCGHVITAELAAFDGLDDLVADAAAARADGQDDAHVADDIAVLVTLRCGCQSLTLTLTCEADESATAGAVPGAWTAGVESGADGAESSD